MSQVPPSVLHFSFFAGPFVFLGFYSGTGKSISPGFSGGFPSTPRRLMRIGWEEYLELYGLPDSTLCLRPRLRLHKL